MERRIFIKKSCTLCLVGFAALSAGIPLTAAAKGKKAIKAVCNENNEVIIPSDVFSETNMQIVRVKNWDYDLAVVKQEDETLKAFLLKCTHMDNGLQASADGFFCAQHGSTYDAMGNVLKGPAEAPLTQYHARFADNGIIITP